MKNKLTTRYRHLFLILTGVALLLALAVTSLVYALSPGSFEGADGNLIVDASGATDWVDAPDREAAEDKLSGSSDDAFKRAKEDDPDPTIAFGSIPNNKSDLKRFYVAHEKVWNDVAGRNDDLLYLAWERANTLGSANIDFEFNQSPELSGNGVTPQRMAGDMLITYTFGGNDGAVEIGLSRWIVGGGTCEAASSTPCWGVVAPLTEPVAQAAINLEPVYEPFLSDFIPEQTFGEVALNLTAAGVFSDPNVCVNFGSVHVKSRSSGAFNASLKDFIAPIQVNVSNCGSLTVNITTDPDNGVTYTFNTVEGQDPEVSVLTDDSATYTLLPGDYSFTVTAPEAEWAEDSSLIEAGYDLVAVDCTATGDGTSVSWDTDTGTVDVTIAEDGTVECEYTFVQRGSIIVAKQTDPSGAASRFAFSGDVDGDAVMDLLGSITDGETIAIYNLVAGPYLVTEDDPTPGFDLTAIDCDDGLSASISSGNVETRTATFDLDAGETVTCTFTNTKRGTIVVKKQTAGGDGSFTFSSALGALGPISNGGMTAVDNLVPGAYTITEDDPTPGFDLTAIDCDDGNSSGDVGTRTATFNLDPGEIVTCTFTNTKRGTIIVEKQTDPDGAAGSFTFNPSWGASFLLGDGGSEESGLLVPGAYTVTETDPAPAFDLTSIACDDGNSSGNVGTRTATFNLDPGETVTCTFTNTKRAQIFIQKETFPSRAPESFGFTLTGGPSNLNQAFSLVDGGQHPSGYVMPGSGYLAEEPAPRGKDSRPNWDLTGVSCVSSLGHNDFSYSGAGLNPLVFQPGDTAVSIDAKVGDVVTCTFTNTKRGTIVVIKDAMPDGPQDFDFTITSDDTFISFSLDDDGDETDNPRKGQLPNTQTFTGLVPGSYTVVQFPVEGFDARQILCTDSSGNPLGTVNLTDHTAIFELPAGETVTCLFNDNERGYILVEKFVQNGEFVPELEFIFNASYPDPVEFPLSHGESFLSVPLPSGVEYSISEQPEDGWIAASQCVYPNGDIIYGEIINDEETISPEVPIGDTVVCSFTNTMQLHAGSTGFWKNQRYGDLFETLFTNAVTGTAVYDGLTTTNAITVADTIFDKARNTPDQNILAELTALKLNLEVSKNPDIYGPNDNDDICLDCLLDLEGYAGTQGGEQLIQDMTPGGIDGPITVGHVVNAVEAAWYGTLVGEEPWRAGWSFDAPILPGGESLTVAEKALLTEIVESINQGWTVVVDPSTYPDDPGCLLATGLSIEIVGPFQGTEGAPYSHTLGGIAGGTSLYIWGVVSGSLPEGLTLDSNTGEISGVPTSAGSFSFSVLVMDSSDPNLRELQWVTITINPPLVISHPDSPVSPDSLTSPLPDGMMGVGYGQTMLADGGTLPSSWSITAGALPSGLTLDASSGLISGTPPDKKPHKAKTYVFTVMVTDAAGATDSRETSITIQPPA